MTRGFKFPNKLALNELAVLLLLFPRKKRQGHRAVEENKYVDFPAPSLINTKIKRNFTIVEINEDCPAGRNRQLRYKRYLKKVTISTKIGRIQMGKKKI